MLAAAQPAAIQVIISMIECAMRAAWAHAGITNVREGVEFVAATLALTAAASQFAQTARTLPSKNNLGAAIARI
jgi:hypothetical protein